MSSKGNIKEFNIASDNWQTYVARVRAYFTINDVKPADETTHFIALAGNECYDLIANLCNPRQLNVLQFGEIVEIVENHLSPKPSEIAERMHFRSCKQSLTENLNEYILHLRTLAKKCNFKTSEALDENLRDQLVFGMKSDSGRQRLLTEKKLTFQRAVEIALSLESAEKEIQHSESSTQVMAITARGGQRRAFSESGGARADQSRGAAAHAPAPSSSARGARARFAAKCFRCGSVAHNPSECAYLRATCFKCNKVGHISHVCKYIRNNKVYYVESDNNSSDSDTVACLYQVVTQSGDGPWYCDVKVDKTYLKMQVDTGSSISAISEAIYNKYFTHLLLQPSSLHITVYSGHKIKPKGELQVNVSYNKINYLGKLYVMPNDNSPIIIGRKWIRKLGIKVPYIAHVSSEEYSDDILNEYIKSYPEVFSPGMGRYNKGLIKLEVAPGSVPVWRRARTVPYALRDRVDKEIERLLADGVISPMEMSEWGTPIVIAFKKSGDIRLCGDFKVTLNPVLIDDKYPLPRITDIFSSLNGGKLFSKIDLKHAYLQLELDNDSKKLCTITTHRGNFCYNRLPFGIKCAPSKFQRIIDKLFSTKHVTAFLDDILVTGSTLEEHKENLHKVFMILNDSGLKVAREKCTLFQTSVSYLGHTIDAQGLHTEQHKVDAIFNAESPTNITELKSFLGIVNYYGKFIADLSTILAPLYDLLNKKAKFIWNESCEEAFNRIKSLMKKAGVLAHFDPNLPIVISCDASPYGVSAVLAQRGADGGERAVQHASRRLSVAERNYSQLCREGLAVVFGVKRFHDFIYGRHFTLVTDCKPLASIFGIKSSIPQMMAGRLQRWALLLSAYDHDIRCVKSNENCLADCLSRHPVSKSMHSNSNTEDYYLNFIEEELPVTFANIAKETAKDPFLFKVLSYVTKGWPDLCDKQLNYFYQRREYLIVDRGCLFYGYRIIIPRSLQSSILKQLHSSHQGIVKTKSLARSYICWQGLDKDIEDMCKKCLVCVQQRNNPQNSELRVWPWPEKPWSRLHLDFLGKFVDKYYLIVVDAHSKWLEVKCVNSTNAELTVKCLRELFACFGLPEVVVTDNGPPFQSASFKTFVIKNGIKHITSPPYHPRSNGLAENYVAQVKKCIKKALVDRIAIDIALSRFLLVHRNTPSTTTGKAPSELLLGRTVKTYWDLLRPSTKSKVLSKQESQSVYFGGKHRSFEIGDIVGYKQYINNKEKWKVGKILSILSPLVYEVGDKNDKCKRHIEQIIDASNCSLCEGSEDVDKECVVSEPLITDVIDEAKSVSSSSSSTPQSGTSDRVQREKKPVSRYGFENSV